jgi:two-component system phosphate regulon sensor histidine kinase PhoR
MTWLLPRILAVLLAMALGALVGYLCGGLVGAPFPGMGVGAAAGVAIAIARDTLRAVRFIAWLRGSQADEAPRDSGLWGEIAYRVERAIRERERRLANQETRLAQFLSAMEASPNGVLLLDSADQIDWCNGVAADHFGLDPQRDRRQRITNLVRDPLFVAYLQARRFGDALVLPRARGRGTLSVAVREYGEGQRLVLSQDITERQRAEAMRRDFVANVSHEIRTPLTVLAGAVDTMSNLSLNGTERDRVLQLMSQQTQRMQALVSDLLTLARLEGSPRPPADRWVPLSRIVQAVMADAAALSAGRHQLDADRPDGVELAGDATELQSALGNLVSNAVRYTPEGGHVAVRWRLLANGAGELSVHDTGIGIDKEHLPRLSERFYRVDGSRSRDTGGTGLGLSIVKHVAQRHGGELDIHSESGRGSTFRLLIPAARVRAPAPGPAHAATPAADSPATLH